MKPKQAFPSLHHSGLSKREYFAALAMQGLIVGITQFRTEQGLTDIIVNRPKAVSELAVRYADMLIEELSKGQVLE